MTQRPDDDDGDAAVGGERAATQRDATDGATQRRGTQRERAVELFGEGATTAEVGAALGISRVTAWRWLSEPETRHAIGKIRDARASAAGLRLEYVATRAVDVLDGLLDDRDAPHAVRLRAACELLDRVGFGHADRAASARMEREASGFLAAVQASVDAPTYARILAAVAAWDTGKLELDALA